MLHASISGGIDRNLYALLEDQWMASQKGKKPMLPVWLSPVQVRIVPIAEEHQEYCEKLLERLESESIRADLDDESNTMQKKVRNAEKEWVPYIVVVGSREMESGKLAVRVRAENGKQAMMTAEELIERVRRDTEGRPFKPLPLPNRLSKRPRFR
jgi:threonyl-tRNA synthetase